MRHPVPPATSRGFTLIELMVTLALMVVMLAIAAPSFTQYRRNSELTSLTNTLVGAINAARIEAMKRGRNAMIVPLNNGADWNAGWTVFVDTDRTQAYNFGTDILISQQASAVPSYISVSGNGTAAETPSYILFDASGYSKTKSGGFGALTLSLARSDLSGSSLAAETRRIVIAATGRVRACKPSTDSTCTNNASE